MPAAMTSKKITLLHNKLTYNYSSLKHVINSCSNYSLLKFKINSSSNHFPLKCEINSCHHD